MVAVLACGNSFSSHNVCALALAVAADCRLSIINCPHLIVVREIRRFANRVGRGRYDRLFRRADFGEASAVVAAIYFIAGHDSGFGFVGEVSGTR